MVLAEDLRGVNLGKEREERKEMGGLCEERREREVFLGERGNGNENGKEEEEKSLLTVPVAADIFGGGRKEREWEGVHQGQIAVFVYHHQIRRKTGSKEEEEEEG